MNSNAKMKSFKIPEINKISLPKRYEILNISISLNHIQHNSRIKSSYSAVVKKEQNYKIKII